MSPKDSQYTNAKDIYENEPSSRKPNSHGQPRVWPYLDRAAVLDVPAQYTTIQAAVNAAAAGDEIQIAPGVYTEQAIIDRKNLTLTGRPGTVLRAFAGMTTPKRGRRAVVSCSS